MNPDEPLPLLGGLSPARFMRRHWQKKPLLVRGALDAAALPAIGLTEVLALARRDDAESRLVERGAGDDPIRTHWRLRHGPLTRLPSLRRGGWTVLVQGVDLLDDRARALLDRFRFVPDARLDDLMISVAGDGGGVGPHTDSYDVFLIQLHGRRHWRWGRGRDRSLVPGLPLKILARFEPEHEAVLGPGDLLYLPPGWAHDGAAVGPCMTASVGFRSPSRAALAADLLARLANADETPAADRVLYRDPRQPAVAGSAALPPDLLDFARDALRRALARPDAIERALGEALTEPKAHVVFEPGPASPLARGLRLDRRSRMLYDARHVFLNGESWRASGADARLLHRLADRRRLERSELARASDAARALLTDWLAAGWLHGDN